MTPMAKQQGRRKKLQTSSINASQNPDFLCDFDMHTALDLYPPGGGQKTKASIKPSEQKLDYESLLRYYPPQSGDLAQKDVAGRTSLKGELRYQLRSELKRRNIDATIDLHGLFQEEARERLEQFVQNAHSHGLRKICIVHGKGHHSSEGKGILQGMVRDFLQTAKAENKVLEFHHPAERYGGRGATIALLNRNGKRRS